MNANHTIGVVSRRTGLSTHLIRIWERRYKAVEPKRTETNRRLYTDDDIQRLSLLHRATKSGESISQIARLTIEELQEILNNSGESNISVYQSRDNLPTGNSRTISREEYLNECIKAVVNLEPATLETLLLNASVELSVPILIDQIIEPLAITIGNMWHAGTIRVLHEHQASEVLRTFLGNLSSPLKANIGAPKLLATTPAGQLHEFGALISTVVGANDGWHALYLGRNMPTDDIISASKQTNVKAIALSIVYPHDDPLLHSELRKLKSMMPDDVSLIVGGQGTRGYMKTLREIGALIPTNMNELRSILHKIRSTPSTKLQ